MHRFSGLIICNLSKWQLYLSNWPCRTLKNYNYQNYNTYFNQIWQLSNLPFENTGDNLSNNWCIQFSKTFSSFKISKHPKPENCEGDLSGHLWSVPETVCGQDRTNATTEVKDLIIQINKISWQEMVHIYVDRNRRKTSGTIWKL